MLLNCLKRVDHARYFSYSTRKSIGILGVPFSKGQDKTGVEDTPQLLRQAGLVNIIRQNDQLIVNDYGDLKYEESKPCSTALSNMKNYSHFLGCSKALVLKVQDILKENEVYLAVGGDHSIGFGILADLKCGSRFKILIYLGSVAGHLLHNPNLSLIWIDAHPDINLNVSSASGNIHGMPVALLIKELRKYWEKLDVDSIAPICLPARELVYIGLRDIDPHEAYILNKFNITYFAMDAIDKFGISKVIEMSLEALNPDNALHVSFDIDALDINVAPSTGTAVHGGLTLRESLCIMETLSNTNRVKGLDLVEINPQIGSKQEVANTLSAAKHIIKSFCGHRRYGNINNKNLTDTL